MIFPYLSSLDQVTECIGNILINLWGEKDNEYYSYMTCYSLYYLWYLVVVIL